MPSARWETQDVALTLKLLWAFGVRHTEILTVFQMSCAACSCHLHDVFTATLRHKEYLCVFWKASMYLQYKFCQLNLRFHSIWSNLFIVTNVITYSSLLLSIILLYSIIPITFVSFLACYSNILQQCFQATTCIMTISRNGSVLKVNSLLHLSRDIWYFFCSFSIFSFNNKFQLKSGHFCLWWDKIAYIIHASFF